MRRGNEWRQILSGIILLLGLHFVVIVILAILAYIVGLFSTTYIFAQALFFSFFGIGLFQLFYVIPLIILLIRRQEWGEMKGVIIGAVFTALLNGSCFLLVFYLSV